MKDFTFQLYYTTFTIPPAGYTFDLEGNCVIAVSYLSDSSNLCILGDTFLRNFVSTFDYKDYGIRLGININMKYFTYSIFSSDMTKPRV